MLGWTLVAELLRGEPVDTSTAKARGRDRIRRAIVTSAASVSARGLALVAGLVSIPIAVRYLGPERYGLWQTIAAAVSLLTFADLGLGNSVMNAIASAKAQDDRAGAAEISSSGFFVLLAVGTMLLVAFALTYSFVDWPHLFNIATPPGATEAGPATAVFVACIAFGIPLGLVQRIQFGEQEGFIANLWQGVGSVAALGGLLAAVILRGSLPALVFAMTGIPLLAIACNWIQESRRKPWVIPRLSLVHIETARHLTSSGLVFLILQATVVVTYASDALIANRVLGPAAVSEFSIAQRIFVLVPTFIGLATMPLWPAFTEAYVRGELDWVRRTFKYCLLGSLGVASLGAVIASTMAVPVISWWAGSNVAPSSSLAIALGLWSVMYVFVATLGLLMNATNGIRFEAIVLVGATAGSIGLKILAAPYFGLPGIVYAGVIAYVGLAIIPCGLFVSRTIFSGRKSYED